MEERRQAAGISKASPQTNHHSAQIAHNAANSDKDKSVSVDQTKELIRPQTGEVQNVAKMQDKPKEEGRPQTSKNGGKIQKEQVQYTRNNILREEENQEVNGDSITDRNSTTQKSKQESVQERAAPTKIQSKSN